MSEEKKESAYILDEKTGKYNLDPKFVVVEEVVATATKAKAKAKATK